MVKCKMVLGFFIEKYDLEKLSSVAPWHEKPSGKWVLLCLQVFMHISRAAWPQMLVSLAFT